MNNVTFNRPVNAPVNQSSYFLVGVALFIGVLLGIAVGVVAGVSGAILSQPAPSPLSTMVAPSAHSTQYASSLHRAGSSGAVGSSGLGLRSSGFAYAGALSASAGGLSSEGGDVEIASNDEYQSERAATAVSTAVEVISASSSEVIGKAKEVGLTAFEALKSTSHRYLQN